MEPQTTQIGTSRLNPQPEEPAPEIQAAAPAPPPPPMPTPAEPMTAEQVEDLRKRIVETLRTCFDPEIPVNIYELGLIYQIDVDPLGMAAIKMTLTSPMCPVAGTLPGEVQRKILHLPGVSHAEVELVWDPPWDKSRMSEAAKLQLGIDDY